MPVSLFLVKLAPALMAGNTVVAKPAPTTPLTTMEIAEIWRDVIPAGVLKVVCDANDLGGALSAHPDVAKIAFTGSTVTGKKVMASAAGTLKRVTLDIWRYSTLPASLRRRLAATSQDSGGAR